MDNGRNYIIDRLKSKKMSIDEFNFETLSAPPLSMFFSSYDIWQLNNIAKSIKLAGKPQEKLKLINEICRSRGLVKFGAGTNRVIYRHPEFNNIVFKIAYDSVGLQDNPAEFRNQHLLKPFVAKTFEISPCGTVAISERVEPVRSREEFLSIADDVFTLLNEFVIGKYIMDDIGVANFLNLGVRSPGFGVVILDYAFLYELDGNKIYCNKPDPTSPTGLCEGEICYDDGFNHLYCTKCNAQYKAIELQKKIQDNEIIVKREGVEKMKITVRGGSTNANMTINNGVANENFRPTVNNIIRNNESRNQASSPARKVKVNITPKVEAPKRPTVNISRPSTPTVVPTANISKPSTPTVVDVEEDEVKSVNGVTVEAPKTSMSMEEFVSSITEEKTIPNIAVKNAFTAATEPVEPIEVPAKSPVEIIDDAVNIIIENLQAIKIDVVREDAINRILDKIMKNIPANGSTFKNVIEVAMSIYENAEDDAYIDVVHSAKFIKLVDRAFNPIAEITDIAGGVASYDIKMAYSYDDTHEDAAFIISGECEVPEHCLLTKADTSEDTVKERIDDEEIVGYSGMQFNNAMIIAADTIFPDAEKQDVIVGIDENGDYIVNKENNIIAYNIINDVEVDSVALVSKEWVKSVDAILNEGEEEESDETATVMEE